MQVPTRAQAQMVQKQTASSVSGEDKLEQPKITISEVGPVLCDNEQADSSLTSCLTSSEKHLDISGKVKTCH